MDVFYYTTFSFITTKPILFYFQIIAVNKTYRKSNSSYDNISHVKEAFTLESIAAKKKKKEVVYVEKLKNYIINVLAQTNLTLYMDFRGKNK